MPHANFLTFTARDRYDLGRQLGVQFKNETQAKLLEALHNARWNDARKRGELSLSYTAKYLPQYVEELQGFADGAEMPIADLWALSIEDEAFDAPTHDRCTTMVTNGGKLLVHNEDWEKGAENLVSIVQKNLPDISILELYYFPTLGGNSVSINSHGFITAVNSLVNTDRGEGVPRNVIARFLSETIDPSADFEKIKAMPRGLGYSINILETSGNVWNIEYSSTQAAIWQPKSPFVHTNHYLTDLKIHEGNNDDAGTFTRHATASRKLFPNMSSPDLVKVSNDESEGPQKSILNERTIAKIIINLEIGAAKIWLAREEDEGFVEYPFSMLTVDN